MDDLYSEESYKSLNVMRYIEQAEKDEKSENLKKKGKYGFKSKASTMRLGEWKQ